MYPTSTQGMYRLLGTRTGVKPAMDSLFWLLQLFSSISTGKLCWFLPACRAWPWADRTGPGHRFVC